MNKQTFVGRPLGLKKIRKFYFLDIVTQLSPEFLRKRKFVTIREQKEIFSLKSKSRRERRKKDKSV